MEEVLRKYDKILQNMECQPFPTTEEQRARLFFQFGQQTKNAFKVSLKFDLKVVQAMIDKLTRSFNSFYYSQEFMSQIKFMKMFGQILEKNQFISKRGLNQLEAKIQTYMNDPCLKYSSNLIYLQSSQNLQEFRCDFFIKLCGQNQDEIQDEWDEDTFQTKYQQFWSNFLKMNPKQKLVIFLYSCFCKFQDPNQMLTPQLISKINLVIGQNIGKSQIQMSINKKLIEIAELNSYEHSKENKLKNEKQYDNLCRLLGRFSSMKKFGELKMQLKISKFGSLISGFAGTDADLDVTIITNTYVHQDHFLQYLCDFLTIQYAQDDRKSGRTTEVKKIDASTPLVQLKIRETRRDQPFKIDILVNNIVGVINSQFLRVYSKVNWIRNFGIIVKLWAKASEIIGSDLLSSYATILLMLHFLIQKKYVNLILDARGRIEAETEAENFVFKRIKKGTQEIFPVYYKFKTDANQVTKFKNVNMFELFKQFTLYYSETGEHWKLNQGKNIINVDGSTEKAYQQERTFTIRDPFDLPHNPGRSDIKHKSFFQKQFTSAYKMLRELQLRKKTTQRNDLLEKIFEKR